MAWSLKIIIIIDSVWPYTYLQVLWSLDLITENPILQPTRSLHIQTPNADFHNIRTDTRDERFVCDA